MSPIYSAIALVVLLTTCTVCQSDSQYTYCAFKDVQAWQSKAEGDVKTYDIASASSNTAKQEYDPSTSGEIQPDNKTIKCLKNRDHCYSLWEVDNNVILKQGCWVNPTPDACQQTSCLSSSAITEPPLNNSRFCCCQGNYCNVNVTDVYVPKPVEPSDPTPVSTILPDPNYKERTIIIAITLVLAVAIITAVFYLIYRLFFLRPKEPEHSQALMEPTPPAPNFELDPLKLLQVVASGRYGEVWRGMLGDNDVAVKRYSAHHKQYFQNERDIYMLPYMEKDTIPRFYGASDHIDPDGTVSYMLVMDYLPVGTLTHYLHENVIDWNTMSKMAYSVTSGLAFLHTDITKHDKVKPAIAHRDFNTRNILVRNDLTCCICDFGFAMKIQGSRFFRTGVEESTEQASLADVGTLRYMAPEVLEGAVNLRDCEASLKQIDMYALGLVLWEIASRCSDLYQGMPVPTYKLPFQDDVGLRPSFESMQICVSKNKKRPRFPDVWKDTNQVIRALKETIDDCWDHDAEARLTSLCAEERVLDMMALWETRLKGVTPTYNVMGGQAGYTAENMVRNPTMSTTSAPLVTMVDERADPNGNVPNTGAETLSDFPEARRLSRTEHSMSASTTETTLTTSPTEPSETLILPSKANRNLVYAKANNRALQPHQGQNPTVERNTHKRSDEELAVLGNILVDKAVAAAASHGVNDAMATQPRTGSMTEDLIDQIADNLESSLVQNDLLGAHQRLPPVPHNTQNAVVAPGQPMAVRRKQPNVPGNGSASQPPVYAPRSRPVASYRPEPKKSRFRFKKPLDGKFSLPFFGRKRNDSTESSGDSDNYPTENLRQWMPPPQLTLLKQSGGHVRSMSDGTSNVAKSNLEPRPPQACQTEVCMLNGAPVVRPTSLPLAASPQHYNVDCPDPVGAGSQNGLQPAGAAASQNAPLRPAALLSKKTSSNVDLSPSGSANTEDRTQRPRSLEITPSAQQTVLPSNGNSTDSSDSNHNVIHSQRDPGATGPKDAPGTLPEPVDGFGLFDEQPASQSATGKPDHARKSSISLRQFGPSEDQDLNHCRADYRC